jgi:[ribosomal protein S5]-alanine N-acetyltransferase
MKTRVNETKTTSETFKELLRTFGDSVSEIMDDPAVKEKAKAFAESVVDAAAKVGQSRVKNEEIRAKYRNVGKAAQTLGNSLDKHFTRSEEGDC